ncbi:TetR family transcriptional regulator [Nocardioides carbamazepini]|uniref:TetR family transcriptional regulator n=1 Tax=Nocardioides carbamazepini TaxID=2854259 RepID=UPI00214A3068|nr:TetR/AcrR family transcriptional regulator [Nocardioides carbamazepini]MCR1783377.1 TetR family transcriptional regulator [Nocardioides carbamazepini]
MSYLARAARRQSIVDAAAAVVARDGLSAVTARVVAEELRGSPGQIHHHFASTDELAAEAWRHYARAEIETYRHEITGLAAGAALALFFADLVGEEGQEGTALDRWAEAGAHAQLRPLVGASYLETLADLTDVLAAVLAAVHPDRAQARQAAGRLLMLGVGLAGTTRIHGTPPVPVQAVMRSAIDAETS